MMAAQKKKPEEIPEVHPEDFQGIVQALDATTKKLASLQDTIADLEEKLRVRDEEHLSRAAAARVARISLAMRRYGFPGDRDEWVKFCKRIKWPDPTKCPPPQDERRRSSERKRRK